jgi:two-component system sensor histidine kinase CpxA
LQAASDSVFGHGMFFEPEPWVLLALAIVALAALLWLPFVRHLTRPIARLTDAAGQIAQGRFDVRVHESRNDEIGVLARSVNEMAVRLDEYLLGQRRFLGDVAHELASPLARLQLGLAILERQRPDDEKLQGVIQEARRLADLVNEVLSFSRAAVNQSRVRLGPVPLAPVIARVLERECHDGATVEVKVENDFVVLADAELLARALANLVRNACRHAGRDGPITVAAARHHDEIQLEVRDSGPGVPAEMSPHLFEPFYRPEPSRDRATGGVGLGLSIVKTCVEACRGRVTARNVEPHGFAVTITLPIVD